MWNIASRTDGGSHRFLCQPAVLRYLLPDRTLPPTVLDHVFTFGSGDEGGEVIKAMDELKIVKARPVEPVHES